MSLWARFRPRRLIAEALGHNSKFIPATGVSLRRPISTQKVPGRRSTFTSDRQTLTQVRRYPADFGVLAAIELVERSFEICASLRLPAYPLRRLLSSICRERKEL